MLTRFIGLSALALMTAIAPAYGQPSGEVPRWLRFANIAPDGQSIAFTHRGQIFIVPAEGGLAVPISSQKAYSHRPVWSDDSTKLAFASDITGNDDVYLTDFSGSLQRLTFSSAGEYPVSFSPGAENLLYSANRLGDAERSVQGALTGKTQIYEVALDSGRENLVLPNHAEEARWNKDKTRLVYSYDPSIDPAERQHRVAANARQLWTFDPVSGRHEAVFATDGVDRLNPVWGADGATLYYLSEKSGRLNVWSRDPETGAESQITDYADDAVKYLSVADDGTLAYTHNGRIYVRPPGAESAEPIEIETLEQVASEPVNLPGTRSQDFSSAPNGKLFAHIFDTDVFLGDTKGNFRRITQTPGEERGLSFAPDSTMLAYAAQRDHKWGIYAIDLKTEDDKTPLANSYEERALVVLEDGNAMYPSFSPDGKKIAYWVDRRELKIFDLEKGESITLFGEGDYNSSYADGNLFAAWSPNSEQIAVDWNTADASEIRHVAIFNADGTGRAHPIGNVPNFSGYIWSVDGTQLIGTTDLYANRTAKLDSQSASLYRIFISEDARQDFIDSHDEFISTDKDTNPDQHDKTPAEETASPAPDTAAEGIEPAEDNTESKAEPEAKAEAEAGAEAEEQSAKTTKSYTVAGHRPAYLEGRLGEDVLAGEGFYAVNDEKIISLSYDDETLTVTSIDLVTDETETVFEVPAENLLSVQYLKEGKVLDLRFAETVLRVPLNAPNEKQEFEQRIFYSRDAAAARSAAFEQAWADIKYRFYDKDIEGRDWDAIGTKYRAYVPSVASDRELASLISAMLGEISASHLFVSYDGSETSPAGLGTHEDSIGVYLDYGYTGPGRRIAAVLPNGPLDRRALGVEAGDIITSINGQPVPDAGGLDRLLDLNAGKHVQIGLLDDGAGNERVITVKPVSRWDEQGLAKARLLDAREQMVQRLSNSCIAYSYVPEMNNDSYLSVLSTLSAQRGTAKAALIDVRSNGGGNLTRELITLLSGKAYATMGREDGPKVVEPNNRWNWPSAIIVDSFGYSDGSVFPQAYSDMKLGTIVGETVLNTGTAVDYVKSAIVPGLTYGIPVLPSYRLDGSNYENNVIEPDLHMPFDPNSLGLNTDPQLEAAVAALMQQVGAESDCRLR